MACERALQAAVDILVLSMCSEQKSFSIIGQNTPRSMRIESSKAQPTRPRDASWLNTVPILNQKTRKIRGTVNYLYKEIAA